MTTDPQDEARREAERQAPAEGGGISEVLDAAGNVVEIGYTVVEIAASSAGQAVIGAAGAALEGTATVAKVSLEIVGSVLSSVTDI